MDQQLLDKVGKYVVWFIVLIAIGYGLGIIFNVALFVLPGVLLIIALWYLLKNMSDKGILVTLKTTMAEPFGYIKEVFFIVFRKFKE